MSTVKLQNSSIFVNVSDAGKIHGQNSNETSGASEDLCTSHVKIMLTVLHTFLLTGIQAFKIGKSRAISSKSSKFSLRYALGKLFACRKRLIMSADKYPSIFLRQMETFVEVYILNFGITFILLHAK